MSVVPINGAHAMNRVLQRLAVDEPRAKLAGLYDDGEEEIVRSALRRAGYGQELNRAALESVGFFSCVMDLEDELIRAAGTERVSKLIDFAGDTQPWRTFQAQQAWHGRPVDQQVRRFIRSISERNSRYIRVIIETIEPSTLPRPLRLLLDYVEPNSG